MTQQGVSRCAAAASSPSSFHKVVFLRAEGEEEDGGTEARRGPPSLVDTGDSAINEIRPR